jgi:hypothetical protein
VVESGVVAPESVVMVRQAAELGLAREAIEINGDSCDTFENATFTLQIAVDWRVQPAFFNAKARGRKVSRRPTCDRPDRGGAM